MSGCFQPWCEREPVELVNGELCCEQHAVLRRAGWRCEAIVDDPRPWKQGEQLRCVIVGSEVAAVNGEARCPRHRDV